MIHGQGTHAVGEARECDKTDQVVFAAWQIRAAINETIDHIFQGGQAIHRPSIACEVHGQHGA